MAVLLQQPDLHVGVVVTVWPLRPSSGSHTLWSGQWSEHGGGLAIWRGRSHFDMHVKGTDADLE